MFSRDLSTLKISLKSDIVSQVQLKHKIQMVLIFMENTVIHDEKSTHSFGACYFSSISPVCFKACVIKDKRLTRDLVVWRCFTYLGSSQLQRGFTTGESR